MRSPKALQPHLLFFQASIESFGKGEYIWLLMNGVTSARLAKFGLQQDKATTSAGRREKCDFNENVCGFGLYCQIWLGRVEKDRADARS